MKLIKNRIALAKYEIRQLSRAVIQCYFHATTDGQKDNLRILDEILRKGQDPTVPVWKNFATNYERMTGQDFVFINGQKQHLMDLDMMPSSRRGHVRAEDGNRWDPVPPKDMTDGKDISRWKRTQRAALAIEAMNEEIEGLSDDERLVLAEYRGDNNLATKRDIQDQRDLMRAHNEKQYKDTADQTRKITRLENEVAFLAERIEVLEAAQRAWGKHAEPHLWECLGDDTTAADVFPEESIRERVRRLMAV